MKPTRPQRLLEWLVPGGAVVAAAVLVLATAARLPEPMATGWPYADQPIGPNWRALELGLGVVVVALAAVFTWTASLAPSVTLARALVVLGHVASVGWLGRLVRVVSANLDAAHWTHSAATIPIPAILLAAAGAGALGWIASAHRRRPATT